MPSFANPACLLLLLGVPPLIWWWLRRRGSALRFPSVGILHGLPNGRGRVARWGGAIMRAAAFVALALAVAGPRWPDLHSRVETEGIAIALVVDVSGSMAEPDYTWQGSRISRLDAVKRAFGLFIAGGDGPDGAHLDGRPDDLMGLVLFSTRPETACPLTLSHSVLVRVLDAEQPKSIPTESETNIGDAIAWGLHTLESAGSRRKVIILLSDGEHNVPPPALKPRQAAQLAANLHIPIYAIDAGGSRKRPTKRESLLTWQNVKVARNRFAQSRPSRAAGTLLPEIRKRFSASVAISIAWSGRRFRAFSIVAIMMCISGWA